MGTCKDCEYYEPPVPSDAEFFCNKRSLHYRDYMPCKDYNPKENKMNKKKLQERIEKLKDPKQAQSYWMRSKEEQGILFDAGIKNTLQVTYPLPDGSQHDWELSEWCAQLLILKPGYEPDLELRKNRKLARIIAEHIYTMTGAGPGGQDILVERVVLMKARTHSHEELLGGLCIASAKTVIEKLLDEAAE